MGVVVSQMTEHATESGENTELTMTTFLALCSIHQARDVFTATYSAFLENEALPRNRILLKQSCLSLAQTELLQADPAP